MTAALVACRHGLILSSLAATLTLAGCERNLNIDGAETSIKDGLKDQVGLEISSVSCPEPRAMKAGDVFQCTAVAASGGDLTIEVSQTDDSGRINWKLINGDKVISLTAVEENVKAAIARQMKADAVINCGGKVRVSVPGQTFECAAKVGNENGTVVVTMDDDKGNVSWTLK